MALTWAVLGGLTAVASYALAGANDLRQLLVAIGGGALNGTRHGALLGWVVALPVIYRRRPAEVPEPAEPPGPSQPHGPPAAQAPARAGAPYLLLTVLVWLPLVALGVGGRLFASDVTPSNCVSLCFSDRDGTFFLALFASFVAVPMWALQLFALRVLRNTRFRNWPVAGQVVTVLAGGLAVVAAFGAYWLNR